MLMQSTVQRKAKVIYMLCVTVNTLQRNRFFECLLPSPLFVASVYLWMFFLSFN